MPRPYIAPMALGAYWPSAKRSSSRRFPSSHGCTTGCFSGSTSGTSPAACVTIKSWWFTTSGIGRHSDVDIRLLDPANPQPRVINVDKNRAYPTAVEELKVEGTLRRRCRLRQCKYLNNVVEQDHRVSKKRVWLARGYQSFSTAWRTLQGIEAVHMIRKGRARWVSKGDPLAQLQFIDTLFGLAI